MKSYETRSTFRIIHPALLLHSHNRFINSHDTLTSLIAGVMIIVDLKMASQMGKGWEPLCSNCCNFSLQSSWVGYISLISQFQWWYGRYLNVKSRLTLWQERIVYTEERVQLQRRKRSRERIWSIHVHTYKSGYGCSEMCKPYPTKRA